MTTTPRGFTLLIAVVLASVSLAIGIALLDVAYKQVLLSSSARQSQVAFYNADSILECALYYDQQEDAFNYANPQTVVTCNGVSVPVTVDQTASPRTRVFGQGCHGGGASGWVTITKTSAAATGIYATGFNSCDGNNPRTTVRGLKVTY